MTPEHERYAAHLRAHEGSHAIYREVLGFSYVRLRGVRIDESDVGATFEHVPVRGLVDRSGPGPFGAWGVSGVWEGAFCDEHVFRIPWIGLAAYFAPEIVDGVLAVCAALPEGHEGDRHVLDIMDLISDYWDRLHALDP